MAESIDLSAKEMLDIGLEIKRGGSLENIHQLFLNVEASAEDIVKWEDSDLSLNLFQLSIINERFDMVQYFAIHYPAFLDSLLTYKASDHYTHIQDETLLLNSPLHLACLIGNLDTVRYLLDHKETGTFATISFLNLSFESDNDRIKNWKKVTNQDDVKRGKPFEFSILGRNIECIDYLLSNHIIQCLVLRFLYAGVREPSSLLHKACSIGCAPMIQLLLDRSFKDVLRMCDKNGKTPLHLAAWNGNTQSIELLLEHGATVNCLTESRNCLHILYRSKIHPYNYKTNTQVFIDHRLNVHAVDKNGKTALHILCEEIGISRIDVMCYWKKASDAIMEMTVTSEPHPDYSVESYQRILLECLELLLQQGIDPNVMSSQTGGNQVALEVLLQYSSLPYSHATLCLNPEIIYDALEILLRYGADINFQSRRTNQTIFNQFIINYLKDIRIELQPKFINLFCQHGADPEVPYFSPQLGGLPVVIKILERTNLKETADVILGYTSLNYLDKIIPLLKSQIFPRLLVRLETSSGESCASITKHLESLEEVVKNGKMRSLKHTCKFVIFRLLQSQGKNTDVLPLPTYLKNYIKSYHF